VRTSFFAQLDTATQENIKALYTPYKAKFLAIKEDTTTTDEEKKVAIKALHEELKTDIRALIPTDLQDEFDALK
jgi:lipase chaperone LimK